MEFAMEAGIFLAYAGGLLTLYFLGRLLLTPLKLLLKLILSSIIGGVLLIIINIIGGNFGIFIPLNIFTSAAAGILGVPGIILMALHFSLL